MNIQDELQKIHAQYGTTEVANYQIQKLFDKIQVKADKWDKLNEKVSKFYGEDNTEYYDEMGFSSIGEICASHLGYL